MISRVQRYFLEIKDFNKPVELNLPKNYKIILDEKKDFQLNKFFYKNVGKNHHWIDRLIWTDQQWSNYTSDNKVKTYILKNKDDLAGYFELISHKDKKEVEIAYLGLLEEYYNKKLGSYLLSAAIRNSFSDKTKRVWVHTCSLDHQNALNNYLSRGMKIFKKETISI